MHAEVVGMRHSHLLRFSEIIKRHGGTTDKAKVARVFQKIVDGYAELHRYHHDNQHICEMHLLLDFHHRSANNSDALFCAAEGHDWIYRIRSRSLPNPQNEARSAEEMAMALESLGVASSLIDETDMLIRSTDSSSDYRSADADLLHDCDYWVLASPPDRYAQYSNAIFLENASNIDRETYNKFRAHFLGMQLAEGNIFRTSFFRESCNSQAILNIEDELVRLQQAD